MSFIIEILFFFVGSGVSGDRRTAFALGNDFLPLRKRERVRGAAS
ncbi:hypothetical protein ACFWA6_28875 [Streptomyces sp. NPDC060020]